MRPWRPRFPKLPVQTLSPCGRGGTITGPMPTHTSIMHSPRNNSILSAMLAAVIGVGAAHAQNTGAFVNFESPQVHPLDITPDGQTLLATNTADGQLEVFSLVSGLPVRRGSVQVGVEVACAYPPPGRSLTEASPPDGEHLYSITKRIGEEMLREYRDDFHSVIVRFAALFSDWCEYAPLFFFLGTWLSPAWNARLLGGKGLSAVPYLHIREVPRFFHALLAAGIYLPPSPYEVAFLSTAHTEQDLRTLAAAIAKGTGP